jgi:hypothetical protein
MPTTTTTHDRAGWRIREWCRAAGVSRSYYYDLPQSLAPAAITLGRRLHIIIESPADWLRRVGTERRAA